jgi:hypothetical protein
VIRLMVAMVDGRVPTQRERSRSKSTQTAATYGVGREAGDGGMDEDERPEVTQDGRWW